MDDNASQGSDRFLILLDLVRSAWDRLRSRLFVLDERTRFNLLLTIFNIMLLVIVIFALLNRRMEIRYRTVAQTATAAQATATAGQATAHAQGAEECATRTIGDLVGQLTATAVSQATATPKPATPMAPPPTGTATFTPLSPTVTPMFLPSATPTLLPSPVLRGMEILGCNATFRWSWSGMLAEPEWFAVRVWRPGVEPGYSVTWTKEDVYIYTLRDAGEYSWEVAICRGDPAEAFCRQLAVSERGQFSFRGCSR